jgi:hypothetical protein
VVLALLGGLLISPVIAPASAVTAGGTATTEGRDFWVAIPPNQWGVTSLHLAAAADGSATVTIPGIGYAMTLPLVTGQVASLGLPGNVNLPATTGTADLGIHVTSTVDVGLYSRTENTTISTGYTGIPTTSLGTSYRVLSYVSNIAGNPSFLAVVATADATSITVTPRGAPAFTEMLNQGQAYVYAVDIGGDTTGATVTSNKPVSVFGGVQCVFIPTGVHACNPIVQQLPPVEAWGTSFLAVRFAQRIQGDTYRVLANEDNTVVSVDGSVVATLAAGDFYESILPAGMTSTGNQGIYITATKPVLVAQYGNGWYVDQTNGDPLMILVPPKRQFLTTYLITLPWVGDMTAWFINIVTPTNALGSLEINGAPVDPALFAPIGATGWSGAQLPASVGTYALDSAQAFGVTAYEWGIYDGIGFFGGMAMAPVGPVGSVTLSTSDVVGKVGIGNPPCAVATFLDVRSQPIADADVQFAVTGGGVNNQVVNGVTDALGVAHACLPGTVESTGVLTVTVGTATATGTVTWTAALVAPDAPATVIAVPGDGSAQVSWTAPANDGGAAVTGYTATASPGGATCTSTGATSCNIQPLTNGVAYTFTVTATSSVGTSNPSTPSAAVTPTAAPPSSTAPEAPTSVIAVPGDGSAQVSWTAPANDGGTPITGYTVTADPSGATCTSTGVTSCVVSSLTNDVAYTFTVTATNSVGTGPASTASAAVTPTAAPPSSTAPDAPTAVTAVPGDGSAQVSWTAPANDGGAAITGYIVTTNPSGATCTSTGATTCVVQPLTNGDPYTFTVTATNSVGQGPSSAASNPVTPAAAVVPATAPGAPTAVTGVRGNGSVDVSWTAPVSDGGAAITGYTATASPGGSTCTTSGATSCVASSLTNGVSYSFTVAASNGAGTGPSSTPSAGVVPATVPDAPAAPIGTPGDGSVALALTAPANGGAAIDYYVIEQATDIAGPFGKAAAACTAPVTAATCTVGGLTNGLTYFFRVRAHNAIGDGPWSALSAGVTPVRQTSVNHPPTAVGDAYPVMPAKPLTVAAPGILGNDSDPDGDAITVDTSLAKTLYGPRGGKLSLNTTGGFTFTPARGFTSGSESFTVTVQDRWGAKATETVTFTNANHPPTAIDDTYPVTPAKSLTVPSPGILGNDSDPDGDAISVDISRAKTLCGPRGGKLTLSTTGGFTFTPARGFTSGSESFTVTVQDRWGAKTTEAITFSVPPRP